MKHKSQMPFFSDPPPIYYRIMAVVFALAMLPLLFASYLCLSTGEYWPVFIIGGTIYFSIVVIRNLWHRAAMKESEKRGRFNNEGI